MNSERALNSLKATFRFEGMKLSEDDLKACENILKSKTTADEEVKKVLNNFKKNKSKINDAKKKFEYPEKEEQIYMD